MRSVVLVVALLYPFIIYFGVAHLSPGTLAGFLAAIVLLRVLLGNLAPVGKLLALAVVTVAFGLHWWMRDDMNTLRFYPVIINSALLLVFGGSLFKDVPLIENIARKRGMHVGIHNVRYLRVLTLVWTVFFGISVLLSLWTALYADLKLWLFYNGFVSYLLIGMLIIGELIVRYFYRRRDLATNSH